jgi:hypothetical protein
MVQQRVRNLKVDQPPATAVGERQSQLSAGYQSPDFTLQSETVCATLLAVDEPLGDVLYEEGVSVDALAPLEMTSSDSLGLDFGEVEAAEVRSSSTQFDLVEFAKQPAVEENIQDVEPRLTSSNTFGLSNT